MLLAVGILGATCMPHVIYLHSALTQRRIVGATPDARKKIFRFELVDVVIAMTIAGLINMSMLITAAAVFHSRGLDDVGDDLNAVYDGLDQLRRARRRGRCSASPCSPRASPRRASARWPARS